MMTPTDRAEKVEIFFRKFPTDIYEEKDVNGVVIYMENNIGSYIDLKLHGKNYVYNFIFLKEAIFYKNKIEFMNIICK